MNPDDHAIRDFGRRLHAASPAAIGGRRINNRVQTAFVEALTQAGRLAVLIR